MWPFRRNKKVANQEASKKVPRSTKESVYEGDLPQEPYVVTDTLDLHGFFPHQIPALIGDFIKNARSLKLHRLRIVHGKGKSRLKWEVHQALKGNPDVESFGDAPPEGGGWGATVVVLKERGAKS